MLDAAPGWATESSITTFVTGTNARKVKATEMSSKWEEEVRGIFFLFFLGWGGEDPHPHLLSSLLGWLHSHERRKECERCEGTDECMNGRKSGI